MPSAVTTFYFTRATGTGSIRPSLTVHGFIKPVIQLQIYMQSIE